MTAFCIDTIQPEQMLRAEHGVLRMAALTITADAHAAAARIIDKAHAEAEAVREEAAATALRLSQEAETTTLQRADQMLQALELANKNFLLGAQDIIVELAQGLFERLVMEATPREKVEAALRRLQQEAPSKLASPLLRVHPEDFDLLPSIEWEVKTDLSLPRGTCRLEAAGGEWCADFSAAVAALRAAFAQAVDASDASEGAQ